MLVEHLFQNGTEIDRDRIESVDIRGVLRQVLRYFDIHLPSLEHSADP